MSWLINLVPTPVAQRATAVVVAAVIVVLLVGAGGFVASRMGADNARSDVHRFTQPGDDQPSTSACTPGSPQLRGQAALELVDYPWETLGYAFIFAGPRRGYLAITDTGAKTITLFVRSCQSTAELGHTLSHEVAHAVDDRHFDAADRAQIGLYRGYSARPWFPTGTRSDYSSPAGDWAEVFAQLVGPPGPYRSTLNGPPGDGAQVDAMLGYVRR